MLKVLRLALALSAWSVSGAAVARPELVAPLPSVHFIAKGPGGLRFDGRTQHMRLDGDAQALRIDVPLDTLDTGISLRNKHMKETYLETDRYPMATLTVLRSALHPPNGNEAVAEGSLAMHGATQPLRFKYKAQKQGDAIHVEAHADLKLGDYRIETPRYMGIGVKPDIAIDIVFVMKDDN